MLGHAIIHICCLLAAHTAAQSIGDALETAPDLSELKDFLSRSPDLSSRINGEKDITLLAPNNVAFKHLLETTPADDDRADILAYHVLEGVHEDFEANRREMITTVQWPPGKTNITGGRVVLARVQFNDNRTEFTSGFGRSVLTTSTAPIKFDSGVIHILNGVLTMPGDFGPTANLGSAAAFSEAIYTDPARDTNITGVDNLSDVTVFVPIDYVWERIGNLVNDWTRPELDRVLAYHVVEGVLKPQADTAAPAAGKYASLEGTGVTITAVDGGTFVNNAKIVSSVPRIFRGGLIYSTYGVLNPENTTVVGEKPDTTDVAFAGAVMTADFSFPNATHQVDKTTQENKTTGSLSTGAKAAIGAGVAVGAIFAGLALAFFLVRRQRQATIRADLGVSKAGKHWEGQASTSQMQLLQVDSASGLGSAANVNNQPSWTQAEVLSASATSAHLQSTAPEMSRSQSTVPGTVSPPSSPDPLANSSESANTLHSVGRPHRRLTSPRKTPLRDGSVNSQIIPSSPQRAYLVANSPSKAITEQTLSPWKIRVTVEAEPEDGDGPPQYSTQTYQVPLKPCSSPTRPSEPRGRAKAGQSSPARKRRSGTPVRGAGRRKSVTNLDITVLGDDEDEDEWSPQKASRGKKRGTKQSKSQQTAKSLSPQPAQSIEEDDDMYGAGFGTTGGATDESDEHIDAVADSREASSDTTVSASTTTEVRELDTNRVSVRPRSHSTKRMEPEVDYVCKRQQHNLLQAHLPVNKSKTRDFSNTSAVSYPTPSPTPSVPGDEEFDDDEGVGYDTVMESEGFTMIDLESIPSARRYLSSPNELMHCDPIQDQEPDTSTRSSDEAQPMYSKLPAPMPIQITEATDETELSSNVASSPPPAPSMLQAHPQRPSIHRKVTPNPYASPELPPPPTQTKKAVSPDAVIIPPKRVMNAGKALYGALSSSQSEIIKSHQTPISGKEDYLEGFSSGTQRELRSHLRLGEELAKKGSGTPEVGYSGLAEDPQQIWRGEALRPRSPVTVNTHSQTKSGNPANGRSSRLSTSPLSKEQVEGRIRKIHVLEERDRLYPDSDRVHVEAVKSIQHESNTQKRREGHFGGFKSGSEPEPGETVRRKHAYEVREVDERTSRFSLGAIEARNGLTEIVAADFPEPVDCGASIGGNGQEESAEIRTVPEFDAVAGRHDRSGDGDQQGFDAVPASRSPVDEIECDETDIWLLEAQESSSSPHAELSQGRPLTKVQEASSKPRRKHIPSPWKRGEEINETSTMLSNADMSGMLWQQPQDVRFGAAQLARQTKRVSSGNFDLQRMLSSPVKLVTAGRNNLRIRTRHEQVSPSSSVTESAVHDDATRSSSIEEPPSIVQGSDAGEPSSMSSSPPQPKVVPVNFNDSVQDEVELATPSLTGSSSAEEEAPRPPTPRSAMKGGRGNVSPTKQVVFNARSMYLNEFGEESTMSANFDSPAPTPAQPYTAAAPSEASSEESSGVETPKAGPNKGWVNWLLHGSNDDGDKQANNSGLSSVPSSDSVSVEEEASAEWQTTRTAIPSSQPSRPAPPRTISTTKQTQGPRTTIPKLPSYLLPPSFPSLPTSDPSSTPLPLATSGTFTNAHFRTLHILHAKSLRPRFHAPKHVRPAVQALRGLKLTVDESAAGLDVFEWTVGLEECLVIERFMQEVEWGHLQRWHRGSAEEVIRAGVKKGEMEGRGVWEREMAKVGWTWSPEEIARHLGMVVIGEVVREEEREMGRRGITS